ncbi:MAG: thioredoxin domain-containing protein [Myxococcales bacterium]|nr:thioredoxin domain-containing protein [Myxococcales bacterium]
MADRDEDQREAAQDEEPRAEEGSPAEVAASKAPGDKRFGNVLGIVGFLLALAGGFYIGQRVRSPDVDWQGYDDYGRYRVQLRGDEPQLGPDDALVTIIEFSDYQCPYCQKANGPLLEAVQDEDDVRLIFKHHPLPMHALAIPAARAAWAAHQQGKFWEMHEHLFSVGGKVDDIEQVAERMGLDVARFEQDMLSEAARESLESDRYAASVLGIGSTPHFVINGRHIRGALDGSHWERVIEREREEAEALLEQGVARSGLYEHLMASAKAQRAKPSASGPDASKRHLVPAGDDRPSLGPADALVTVVEFSDFQCPYCSKLAPTIHALPGRHEDLRVVFRQLPLPNHAHARQAAIAALAAHRQGKFWELHDTMFAAKGALEDDDILRMAEEVGIDIQQLSLDLEDPALAQMVDDDIALANELKISGTPASFVNGRFISGAQPQERFDTLVEQERDIAQKAVAAGAPRGEGLLPALIEREAEGA